MITLIMSFFDNFWSLTTSIAPYMFLGFIIAGLMDHFFSVEIVSKQIGLASKIAVIKAAILGVPIPLCSCSVLPVAKTLKSLGASNAAVLAFLITTPVTGVDSIYLTWSVLGGSFALARVLLVVIIGILAGFFSLYLIKDENKILIKGPIHSCCSMKQEKTKKNFYSFIYYSFYELPKSVANSLIYGITAGAIISIILPSLPILQNQYLSIVTALIISIPLYVCASGSVPVALALLNNGFNHGAVLAFLVAGPASNFVAIFTIKNILGFKNLRIYLILIFICTFIGSIIFNFIPFDFKAIGMQHTHKHQNFFVFVTSIIFTLMIFYYFILNLKSKKIE